VYAGLSALAAAAALLELPGWPPAYEAARRIAAATAIVLLGVHESGGERVRRVTWWAIVGPAVALSVLAPLALPAPSIDVWQWTQHCARALVHGQQPYATRAPDIYAAAFNYGYSLQSYWYPPLDLLVLAPSAVLLGDYRWMLAACWVASIALLRIGARRLGVTGRAADLGTLTLALHPRAGFMIGMGWHEPLLVAALAGFVTIAARRTRDTSEALALAALPSLKQYLAVPALLYLGLGPRRRAVAAGALAALVVVAPFMVWDAQATLRGLFQMTSTRFRDDGLTVTVLASHLWSWRPGPAAGIMAQLIAGAAAAACLWRARRGFSLPVFLLATALTVHAGFLFASQAFMNYYLFVIACYAMAGLAEK